MIIPKALFSLPRVARGVGTVRAVAVAAAMLAFTPEPARGCGPDFPNRFLTLTESELLAPPPGFFAAELTHIIPARPRWRATTAPANSAPHAHALELDVNELTTALQARDVREPELTGIVASYRKFRHELTTDTRVPAPDEVLLSRLPDEFSLYLRGAAAYRQSNVTTARAHWESLLKLPQDQRRYRSVWAAYMLGRVAAQASEHESSPEILRWFEQVRALAAEGYHDSLALAAESLGWQARAHLERGEHAQAIHLYLEQLGAGDGSAVQSLRIAAHRTLAAESLENVARDATARRVISAYLIGEADREPGTDYGTEAGTWTRWLLAIEDAATGSPPEAVSFAWLAYQSAAFDAATRWASLAPENSPIALWLRAKLALREGRVESGADLLARALAALPVAPAGMTVAGDLTDRWLVPIHAQRNQAWGELGALRVLQGRYSEALDALLAGGHWEDAAYIAERVMTLAELRTWVDAHPPGEPIKPDDPRAWNDPSLIRERLGASLRHLLARRLARARDFENAAAYFDDNYAGKWRLYTAAVRKGFDSKYPDTERAAAFWQAARIVREDGLELLGTELGPDAFIWGGSFEDGGIAAVRTRTLPFVGGFVRPTTDELERVRAHRVPENRFHYRWRAAELAWWAASLMPNDSEETAVVLHTAGSWLKVIDAREANRFYQAIVIRCPRTSLGQRVLTRRWFIPETESGGASREIAPPASAAEAR